MLFVSFVSFLALNHFENAYRLAVQGNLLRTVLRLDCFQQVNCLLPFLFSSSHISNHALAAKP